MSDEEVVREYISWHSFSSLDGMQEQATEALSRILAERDSLRAALERIVRTPLDINDEGDAEALQTIARRALTSSEKETQ